MDLIGGIFIGIIIAGFIVFLLWKNGHLGTMLNGANADTVTKQVVTEEGTVIERIVYVDRNSEIQEYEAYKKAIDALTLSRDYDIEKRKLNDEYNAKITDMKNVRDKAKREVDTIKNNSITIIEKAYADAQTLKTRTKNEADNLWSKHGSERETEKAKARREYDNKIAEIEKLYETRRSEMYKTKNNADNEYSKSQTIYQNDKSKASNTCLNEKDKLDKNFTKEQQNLKAEYDAQIQKIVSEKKTEILSKLTAEQKEQFKKFL